MTTGAFTADGPVVVRPVLAGRARLRQRHRERVGMRVMAALANRPDVAVAEVWNTLPTIGDTVVLRCGPSPSAPLGQVVKVAMSAAAGDGLCRHERMLVHLADTGIGGAVVPEVLATGWVGAQRFVVERAVAGVPLPVAVTVADTRAALAAVGIVHAASAHGRTLGPVDVRRWVGDHLGRIRGAVHDPLLRRTVDALEGALVEAFAARPLVASVVHGDFWPGNVLVVDEPERRVSGIVDWERSSTSGLPERDLAHFLLSARPGGYAAAVRASLGAPDTTVGEWAATLGLPTPNPSLGRTACTALTWALHVGATLADRRRYAPGRLWIRREVVSVLAVLARPGVLDTVAANRG